MVRPRTVTVTSRPRSAGAHSAILRVDDPATKGIDQLVPVTVVATDVPAQPDRTVSAADSVQRADTESVFVAVPAGVQNLELALTGIKGGDQVRFLAIDPYGVPVDDPGEQPLLHPPHGPRRHGLQRRQLARTRSRLQVSGSSRWRHGVRRRR